MPRHFTTEHDREIADLYEAGQSAVEISKRFGVSVTPILRSLRRSGVAIRPGNSSKLDETPEGRARIAAAYESGETITSLARRLKVSDTRITKILDLEEVPRRARRMFSDEEAALLVAAYQAGATTTQLADEHGTNHITIRNYLVRAGVTLRPGGPALFWTDERKSEAARRYLEGESQQKIADSLGVNQAGVSSVLRELGVPIRMNPRAREKNHRWRGGRIIDGNGYVRIMPSDDDKKLARVLAGGYVLEHRLVMAKKIGRRLQTDETVHHINGDKTDNRPENLQLRQGAHGKGVLIVCLDCGSSNVGHTPL